MIHKRIDRHTGEVYFTLWAYPSYPDNEHVANTFTSTCDDLNIKYNQTDYIHETLQTVRLNDTQAVSFILILGEDIDNHFVDTDLFEYECNKAGRLGFGTDRVLNWFERTLRDKPGVSLTVLVLSLIGLLFVQIVTSTPALSISALVVGLMSLLLNIRDYRKMNYRFKMHRSDL